MCAEHVTAQQKRTHRTSSGSAFAADSSTVRASSFAVTSSGALTPTRGSVHGPRGLGRHTGSTAWYWAPSLTAGLRASCRHNHCGEQGTRGPYSKPKVSRTS